MNERIVGVFGGLMALFAGLVVLLTLWQVVRAPELRDRSSNRQAAYYEQRTKRGLVRTRDNVLVARNRTEQGPNGDTLFQRSYPAGALVAHALGYNTRGKSRTGIERTYNDFLTGSVRGLASIVAKIEGDEIVQGDDLRLTIDASAQRIANRALAGQRGAVVALEPTTGRVLVLSSAPSFDPAAVEDDFDSIRGRADAPLINRATQARYAPGSTFKLVTAAAALDEGHAEPDTRFPGGCRYEIEAGPPIGNFGGQCVGGHTLTQALTNSINITFARLGEELGASRMREQMRLFGFDSTPPLDDVPSNERRTSGLYGSDRKLLGDDDPIDVARVAIGQERLQVTPLQMAMVVAAIANGGQLMKPYLVEEVRDPEGRVVRRAETEPAFDEPAMRGSTAAALTEMMRNVVREGSGTAAALQGIDVAGKTGTADTPSGNQVWFVAFAPADEPRVAIAVTLEAQPSGATGGVVAAPVARQVMQDLLQGND